MMLRRGGHAVAVTDAADQPRKLDNDQLGAVSGIQRRVRSAQRQESAPRMHGCGIDKSLPVTRTRSWRSLQILTDAVECLSAETYYLLIWPTTHAYAGPRLVGQTGLSLPKPKTGVVVEKLRTSTSTDKWHRPSNLTDLRH
jgi:hypothetical protein